MESMFKGREHQIDRLKASYNKSVHNYSGVLINHYYLPDKVNKAYFIPTNIMLRLIDKVGQIDMSILSPLEVSKKQGYYAYSTKKKYYWNFEDIVTICKT